jgi:hypothetical protein
MASSLVDDHTDALFRREVEWIVRAADTKIAAPAM